MLVGLHPKLDADANGMNYNTLKANMQGDVHIKLNVMLDIVRMIFPEVEPGVIPGLPREVYKHLTRNEMAARIFAAFLNGDRERMLAVGRLLIGLSRGEEPELEELMELFEKVR